MNTAFRLLSKRKVSGEVKTYGISFNGVNQYFSTYNLTSKVTYLSSGNYVNFKITKPASGTQTILSSDRVYSGSLRDWTWLSIVNGTLTIRSELSSSFTSMTIGPANLFSNAGTYAVSLVWPTTRSYQLTVNGVLYTGTVPSGYALYYKYGAANGVGNTSTLSEFNLFTIHSLEIKGYDNLIHTYENTTGTGTVWEDIVNGENFNLINNPTWVPNP